MTRTVIIPEGLLCLPPPWHLTHPTRRMEQLKELERSPGQVESALKALAQCLSGLPHLPHGSLAGASESLTDYWEFPAFMMAEDIPTLDVFHLGKIERYLQEYEGNTSPLLIEAVGRSWLRWAVENIIRSILTWIKDTLRRTKDAGQAERVIALVSSHWAEAPPELAASLIACSAVVGWRRALPFLETLEHSLSAPAYARETARDYGQWIKGSKVHPRDSTRGPAK